MYIHSRPCYNRIVRNDQREGIKVEYAIVKFTFDDGGTITSRELVERCEGWDQAVRSVNEWQAQDDIVEFGMVGRDEIDGPWRAVFAWER